MHFYYSFKAISLGKINAILKKNIYIGSDSDINT